MSPGHLPVVDDVLSVIRYLGQQNATLELTKAFRGIVVQQDVSALEVNPDEAAFRVSNIEMCGALEGDVFLRNRLFPKPVKAHIKSLDLVKGRVVLSGFTYTDIDWKLRQHERVQPKRPIYFTFHSKGKAVRASIVNISVDGIRVLASEFDQSGIKITPGSNVQMNFELPPDHIFTALKGTIVYINTISRFLTAIGIRLLPKVEEARSLEKYVTQRKQDILEELSQAYWELSRPGGVVSLYF